MPTGPTQLYFSPAAALRLLHASTRRQKNWNADRSALTTSSVLTTARSLPAQRTRSSTRTFRSRYSIPKMRRAVSSTGTQIYSSPNPDNAGGENSKTRFADVALKYISHEYVEALTDPLVGSQPAWTDTHQEEIGDKCNSMPGAEQEGKRGFDSHAFHTHPRRAGRRRQISSTSRSTRAPITCRVEWDNAERACLMQPAPLSGAGFTPASAQATAGLPVSFSGTAIDPYGELEFNWTFGDGTTSTGPSPTHIFAAAGVYTVTMTPKDGFTNSTTTPVSHAVTVSSTPSAGSATTAAASVAPAAPLAPNVVPNGPASPRRVQP